MNRYGYESIPSLWKRVRLADICEINPRKDFQTEPKPDTEVTFVPMSAVDEILGKITEPEVRLYKDVSSGYTAFLEGDVLFAKITPSMENGKAAIAANLVNGIGFGSTEFHVLRPNAVVLAEWIFAFIRQPIFRDAAVNTFTGSAGQQRVPSIFLEKFQIPLPPLLEQQRIVEVLRRADALRQLRLRANQRAEELLSSQFYELFGNPDPKRNQRGWAEVNLGEYVEVGTGGTPRRSNSSYYGGQYPWVKTTELQDQILTVTEESITDEGLRSSNAKIFPVNTVLVAMYGQGQTRGRTAKLGIAATTNQACAALYPSDELLPDYLWYWFQLSYENVRSLAHGGPQSNLNLTIIRNIRLPKPDLKLQMDFSSLVQEHMQQRLLLKQSEAKLEELSDSIVANAFTGELTADWREANADTLAAAAAERDRLLGLRRDTPRPSLGLDLSTESGQQSLAHAMQEAIQSVAEVVARHQGQWQQVAASLANSPVLRLAEEMVQAQRSYQNVVDTALLRSVAQLDERLRRSLAAAAAPLAASLRLSEQMSKAIEPALQSAQRWSEQIVQVAALLALRPDPDDPRYPLLKELSAEQMAVYLAARQQPGYFRPQELADAEELPAPVVERGLAVLAETGLIRRVRVDVSPDGRSSYLQTVYRNLDESRDASHRDVDELNDVLEQSGV